MAACACLGVVACGAESELLRATQVVVFAHSDFEAELVRVDMELYDEQERTLGGHRELELDGSRTFPLSFTIVPPANSTRRTFVVLLRGHDANGAKVETKAKVTFVEKTTLQLDMWLRRACQQASCKAGETCSVGAADMAMCSATPTGVTQELDGGVTSETEGTTRGAVDAGLPVASSANATMTPDGGLSSSSLDGGRPATEAGATVSEAGSAPRESGTPNSGAADTGTPDTGPSIGKDGDPSAPVIALTEVPCRSSEVMNATSNFTYNGRGIILDYPCGKHEGAQLTVLLNLHGTTGDALKYYMRDFFPARSLLSAQNLIIVTPPSVTQQWGNGDGGSDAPYLIDLVNWVHTKFAKARIRSTWLVGHSWGGMYAPMLACSMAFQGRIGGLVVVGAATRPACTTFSVIAAHGTMDMGASLDQTALAAAHGCASPINGPELIGNNERRYYTGCNAGYVHEDYQMIGKMHADKLDPAVVAKIIESIKSSEP